jgi:hypothetical protein
MKKNNSVKDIDAPTSNPEEALVVGYHGYCQVVLKRPVTLSDGITYGVGQHSIPVDCSKDWFFNGLVASGDAVVIATTKAEEEVKEEVKEEGQESLDPQ